MGCGRQQGAASQSGNLDTDRVRCQLIHTSLEALLALSVNDVFTENALMSLNLRGRLLFRSSDAQSIISAGAAVSIGALRRRCFPPSLLLGETPTGPDHSRWWLESALCQYWQQCSAEGPTLQVL